jgi:glucose/arabinose dehydrogenase
MKTIWRGVVAMFCCAVGGAFAQAPATPVLLPKPGEPLTLAAGREKIRVALVADGLVAPWDIVFVPGTSDLLVTESTGALRLIKGGKLVAEPLWRSPSPKGNDVLHGVVVHPDFARNRYVYLSYFKGDDARQTLAISRGKLDGAKLVDVREIFVAEAWEKATMAWVGRMEFGTPNVSSP